MLDTALGVMAMALINFSFICSAWLLYKPTLNRKGLIVVAALTMVFGVTDPLNYTISSFYPEINPQYSTVIYSFAILLLSVIQLFIRARRSIARIMMTLSLTAVIGTTTLFHYLIIDKTFSAIGNRIYDESAVLIGLDAGQFIKSCSLRGFNCHVVKDVSSVAASETVHSSLLRIQGDTAEIAKTNRILHSYYVLNDKMKSDDIAFITYYSYQDERRIVIAASQAGYAHGFVRTWFYIACSVAHLIWISLTLSLLFLHERMISKRK